MSYKCGYPDTMNKAGGTPLMQTKADIKKKKEALKDAKRTRREEIKSKPWKKNESRTEDGKPQWYKEDNEWFESEQYDTRSEHNAAISEEDEAVQNARRDLRAARKSRRKNRKNK